MSVAVALTVLLAAGVGISLGPLGGGGSILAVPLLVYVAGLPAKQAIATSLLVVGATAAVGLIPHARAGRVRWRTGLIFGLAGMAGAYAGGRVAGRIPAPVLRRAFGWFVAMGALVLAQQLPARLWTSPLPWAVIGGSAAAMAGAVLARRRKPPHLGGGRIGGSHAR